MTLQELQILSRALANKGPEGVQRFEWCSQGLVHSAGKISALLVNASFQGHSLVDTDTSTQVGEQLGFLLWYGAVIAD
jgi:hypothetical protein